MFGHIKVLLASRKSVQAHRAYDRTDDPRHLEESARQLERAAEAAPALSRALALSLAATERINLHRHLASVTTEHLARADEHIAAGLACDTSDPYDRSALLAAVVEAEYEHYRLSRSPERLERAIELQEELVALLDAIERASPRERAKAKSNLATLYSSRQSRLGNAKDAQRAAELARVAAADAPTDLGAALGAVNHLRDLIDAQRLDRAEMAPVAERLRTLLESAAQGPPHLRIEAWGMLATAERELASNGPEYDARALQAAETMVNLAVGRPAELSRAWVGCAQVHHSRFLRTLDPADLAEAKRCMDRAERAGGAEFWSVPGWMWIRAEIMFELGVRTEAPALASAALDTYAHACRHAAEVNPGLTLGLSYLWGHGRCRPRTPRRRSRPSGSRSPRCARSPKLRSHSTICTGHSQNSRGSRATLHMRMPRRAT
ncbi:MAG TPA: hypothetical protein VFD59_04925 [Nocardioidaceae bacterium]|nr:hypothetical protein [Nocardioidaceae bacterium]